jgi:ribose transport system ATP-binding protein
VWFGLASELSANNDHIIELRRISKRFAGVVALEDVSLSLKRGEVLAVIGENGAGKSTLMKILAGVHTPDSGEIRIDGQGVQLDSVRMALNHGIALIHQELNLSDNLDVAANIYLGREPRRFGLIDHGRIYADSVPLLRQVGLSVNPGTFVYRLSIAHQQLVEIAKARSTNARVLIMDEPTSSLTQHEAEQLFKLVLELRAAGVSIVYISHRLAEVKRLADRVVVLRDGKNAGELQRDQIDHDAMVRLMVGRELSQFYKRRPHAIGDDFLRVEGLRTRAHPQDALTFTIKRGEMVGIAGLVGAGRTELLCTLFGIDQALAGNVWIAGNPVSLSSPLAAIQAGVGMVPEDRKQQGLILEMAVRNNLSLAALRAHARGGVFLDRGYERKLATEMVQALSIKTPSDQQLVHLLSGGNQQKVVLGKWLALKPRLLLLDEPTRGVDIGAKQEIYRLMEELVESGVTILFVSSEMAEIIGMSDRALVMHEGRLMGELQRDQLSEEAIMQLATGGRNSQRSVA